MTLCWLSGCSRAHNLPVRFLRGLFNVMFLSRQAATLDVRTETRPMTTPIPMAALGCWPLGIPVWLHGMVRFGSRYADMHDMNNYARYIWTHVVRMRMIDMIAHEFFRFLISFRAIWSHFVHSWGPFYEFLEMAWILAERRAEDSTDASGTGGWLYACGTIRLRWTVQLFRSEAFAARDTRDTWWSTELQSWRGWIWTNSKIDLVQWFNYNQLYELYV